MIEHKSLPPRKPTIGKFNPPLLYIVPNVGFQCHLLDFPIISAQTWEEHYSVHFLTSIRQRRRRHFKSGQATSNKRSLVHMQGRGGGLQQTMCGSKNYLWNQNTWVLMQCAPAVKTTCGIKMCGCRCSPVRPRQALDPPAKERERLRETRTRRAKASLRGTPGQIVCPHTVSAV